MFRLETKFPLEFLERRRGSESLHPNHTSGTARIPLPSESGRLLNCDARLHCAWQHTVPVLLTLVFEDIPRRHRYHARVEALGEKRFMRVHNETNFAPRGNQDHLG